MSGQPPAPKALQHVERSVGDRRLRLVGAADRWWLQEGERRIPLRLRETESTLTNSQTHTKEIRRWHDAAVAPLGPLALGDDVEVRSDANGTRLVRTVVTGKTVIYNTVIYEMDRLELSLPPDWSRAEVWVDHHCDMSD